MSKLPKIAQQCMSVLSTFASAVLFASAFVLAFLILEGYHRKMDVEYHEHGDSADASGRLHHRHRFWRDSDGALHAADPHHRQARDPPEGLPGTRNGTTTARGGSVAPRLDACDDFYEFVCGNGGLDREGELLKEVDAPRRPYINQVTETLLNNLQDTFKAYREADPYKDFPSMFINQAANFLPNCTAVYSRNGMGWDPFQDILEDIGLGRWPSRLPENISSLPALVGKVDAALGVFPLVDVTVKNAYESKYAVHLDVPATILKRSQTWYTSSNLTEYAVSIAKALIQMGSLKVAAEVQAAEIVGLEVQLEEAVSTRQFEPPPFRTWTLDKLPHGRAWEWKAYLTALFKNFPADEEEFVSVEVLAQQYLEELAKFLDNTNTSRIVFYVGYRVMVHLSAVLPDVVEHFTPLSFDGMVPSANLRLQACARLLELVYPQGTRTFLRMSLGLPESALRYDTRYDAEVQEVFGDLNRHLQMVAKRTPWYDPVERVVAVEKLKGVKFTFFGTVQNLTPIAEYYNLNVPVFRGTRLLEGLYNMLINSRRTYYRPQTRSRDWDNRFHASSLALGYEYMHGRNALFYPYSNVAALNLTAGGKLRALDIPVLGAHMARGLMAAIDERGSYIDHKGRVRSWWSHETAAKYRVIRDCFWSQYKRALEEILRDDVDLIRTIEDDIADNAIIYPLFRYYIRQAKRTLAVGSGRMLRRLFFVQFARAHCYRTNDTRYERRLAFFGETPPRLRVNLPLANFKAFTEAFGCQEGDTMYPRKERCSLWFTEDDR
ncbi:neprilysin-1 [Dermacentor silvarum]|uniref:neprilysin-1 n=1 Tax=Dermacentor silvarum TaxID=543639 RepID=UPI00189A9D3F|nr:neprilysin-1 [Dermacentor silvarum]